MHRRTLCFLVVFASAAFPEDTSILSRGEPRFAEERQKQGLSITPYAAVSGWYGNGFGSLTSDAAGQPVYEEGSGGAASVGIVGKKEWRLSSLGVNFNASYVLDNPNGKSGYIRDRFQYNLLANYSYAFRLGRHDTLGFQEVVGFSPGVFSPSSFAGIGGMTSFLAANLVDPSYVGAPGEDIYQTMTYFGSSSVNYIHKMGRDWSVRAAGNTFVTYRPKQGLAGVYGATGMGDISRSFARYHVIGVQYSFTHYGFNHAYGATDVHNVGAGYAVTLRRKWYFGLQAGAYRVESERLRSFVVNPYIAAITGQTTGIEAFHGINYGFSGSASLRRAFRHSNVSLNYLRGVSPGNGVYLTSKMDTGSLAYTHSGFGKWSLNSTLLYTRYSALIQSRTRPYAGITGSVGAGRQIVEHLTAYVSSGVRRYDTGVVKRDSYFVTGGLSVYPGTFSPFQ